MKPQPSFDIGIKVVVDLARLELFSGLENRSSLAYGVISNIVWNPDLETFEYPIDFYHCEDFDIYDLSCISVFPEDIIRIVTDSECKNNQYQDWLTEETDRSYHFYNEEQIGQGQIIAITDNVSGDSQFVQLTRYPVIADFSCGSLPVSLMLNLIPRLAILVN